MAVDKVLEIDLNQLTPDSLRRIDDQIENILDSLEDQGKKAPIQQQAITQSEKEENLSKIFGKESLSNLLQAGSNPTGFILSGVTKLIPVIGTALLVTGVIAQFVSKVNDFQAQFIDNVDNRINIFRQKEEQARIQAGLTQLIITSVAGSAEPRDAYNTFNEFNENQQRIENEFQINNTTGVD